MIITHNMQAMATNRIVNSNINAHAKSTSKISSGQRINRAVDNPVGLAISETMRKQIRGLMQGINNTKDGIGFVQVADGAMDEIHAMLQRMNELSLKAANGLCTAEERVALNAEFDQLRTEIDRIDSTTTFNTLPVFDEHEASYYQICGNRKWDDNQLHTITSSTNELNIHLPDGYEPKDYTLTVPAGTYTTQELIDEIDTALSKMDPPNPGFVFELTSDGYCNLNFESAEGKPTKINMIDGGLSYLIYDFQTGGSPASLLGTSPFGFSDSGKPKELEIVKGQNDELGFYAESGEGDKYISITLDPGSYTRDAIIEHINEKLAAIPDAKGIVAKPYGDYYVQITGGDTVNITGLKGNMFKYEDPDKTNNIYTSIFYDNTIYGSSNKTNALYAGYDHKYNIKIYDHSANKNNVLRFQLNGDTGTQFREITLPAGEYTVQELTNEINKFLSRPENKDLADEIEATCNGSGLNLSSKKYGTQSKLIFDTSDPVYAKAYETLFLSRSADPSIYGERLARITGAASFDPSTPITLPDDAALTFKIDGKSYTIPPNILKGQHANLGSLVNKLNSYLKTPLGLDQIINFGIDNDCLILTSLSGAGVKSISISNNPTYKALFTTTGLVPAGSLDGDSVSIVDKQGAPGSYNVSPASVSVTAGPCKFPVTIDGSNNQIRLNLSNTSSSSSSQSITLNLDPGTYNDMGQLTSHINNLLRGLGSDYSQYIQAGYNGSTLEFKITPPKDNTSGFKMPSGQWDLSFSGFASTALSAMMGTTTETTYHKYQSGKTAEIESRYPITNSIELSDQCNNNQLRLYLNGNPYDLTINGTFNSRGALLNAINNALNAPPLNGAVKATLSGDGQISLTPTDPKTTTLAGEGTFYTEVICKGVATRPFREHQGTFDYESCRVIGRRDLTKDPIKITAGMNDTLTFDFTRSHNGNSVPTSISVTIPEGDYQNGYELVNTLNEVIKKQLENDKFFGTDGDFDLSFTIGGGDDNTDVEGSIDPFALHIVVDHKPGKEPDNGEYIIDGVRGSASCYVFYKTASMPSPTYIVGTKDIRDGITFEPGKNELTLSANSIPYKYTFEENKFYTADEFINELNRRFEKGDDNGNSAPLRATLEDGAVKIWHKNPGANTITDIEGSARSTIFFEEEGRDDRDPLLIQVGAEQRSTIELPRLRVNSSSLSINSITISQQKYADKAIERIKGAIKALSDRRSTYGAMQNRLEHTVNNNENVTEQVQAGESRIRDTDMSSELIRYSNLNILLQAGHKMITYSNNNIKKLLTILE